MSGIGCDLYAIFIKELIRVHVQEIADAENIVKRKRYIFSSSAAIATALALKLSISNLTVVDVCI